jgi:RNA polymerase sigma-70 factor (ECF subfamily)
MKLYENLSDLQDRDEKGILAWTYTVSRNLTIDHIRKVSRRNTYTMEEEDLDRVGKVFNNFVKDAIKEEEISTIKNAVDKLDEDDQEILRLRFEEDLKFKEIADIIDKKEGACKMMLYRAVDKVKDNLDENTSKDGEEEKE